jgi:hypothetical protein
VLQGVAGEGDGNNIQTLGGDENGQDIREYGVMLSVILNLVMSTIRLIGAYANNVFSAAATSIQ